MIVGEAEVVRMEDVRIVRERVRVDINFFMGVYLLSFYVF